MSPHERDRMQQTAMAQLREDRLTGTLPQVDRAIQQALSKLHAEGVLQDGRGCEAVVTRLEAIIARAEGIRGALQARAELLQGGLTQARAGELTAQVQGVK